MYQTIFEYLYRDASNYKTYGAVVLLGRIPESAKRAIQKRFDSSMFFVASQIGLPDLRGDLWKWSDGRPNDDDHPWHEFAAFQETTICDDAVPTGLRTVEDFVSNVLVVAEWNA